LCNGCPILNIWVLALARNNLAGHRGDAAIAWTHELPPASANATALAQPQLPERMDISALVAALPCRKAAIFTLEGGALVERAFTRLHADCMNARDMLRGWGVSAGARVGVYAPNSYMWLVFDLALIAIGAVSIAFTEDFRGQIDDVLLDRYDIGLLLTSKTVDTQFPERPRHVAFLDSDEPQDHVQVRHPAPAQYEFAIRPQHNMNRTSLAGSFLQAPRAASRAW
jgi:long-subunit acyl-CoA synthetase (AMP-forming)